jgi:hypothetical protein
VDSFCRAAAIGRPLERKSIPWTPRDVYQATPRGRAMHAARVLEMRGRRRRCSAQLAGARGVEIEHEGALWTISAGCGSLEGASTVGATQKPGAGDGHSNTHARA